MEPGRWAGSESLVGVDYEKEESVFKEEEKPRLGPLEISDLTVEEDRNSWVVRRETEVCGMCPACVRSGRTKCLSPWSCCPLSPVSPGASEPCLEASLTSELSLLLTRSHECWFQPLNLL